MSLWSLLLHAINPDINSFIVKTQLLGYIGISLSHDKEKLGRELLTYPSSYEGAFVSRELIPPYCVFIFFPFNFDVVVAR